MKQFDRQWLHLAALARKANDPRDVMAPFGFALRVVNAATALPVPGPWLAIERVAVRGLIIATAVAAMAFILDVTPSDSSVQVDDFDGADPVGELFYAH